MGNITVSLEGEAEQKLRAMARMKYKSRKGALARVIAESLELLSKESARQRAMERQFSWMDKGFDLGKISAKRRDEIYDRA